jgi:hypothetical protein
MHAIVGVFEVNETSGWNVAIQFESLFSKFGLMHSAITIVTNKNNLTTMAFALCSINNCEPLRFTKIYENTCFGHVMSKTC